MQIFLGADHRGYELKNKIRNWLVEEGHEVVDLGPKEYEKTDDYPDYAFQVAEGVSREKGSLGVVICGSGVGMAVAANKVDGVRAGLISDPAVAKVAREHDDINVLALASDFLDEGQAKEIVKTWLGTQYSGEERHTRRIGKIEEYEQHN